MYHIYDWNQNLISDWNQNLISDWHQNLRSDIHPITNQSDLRWIFIFFGGRWSDNRSPSNLRKKLRSSSVLGRRSNIRWTSDLPDFPECCRPSLNTKNLTLIIFYERGHTRSPSQCRTSSLAHIFHPIWPKSSKNAAGSNTENWKVILVINSRRFNKQSRPKIAGFVIIWGNTPSGQPICRGQHLADLSAPSQVCVTWVSCNNNILF